MNHYKPESGVHCRKGRSLPKTAMRSPPLRVGIVVTPQFTLNALANFVDVLRLASDDGDRSRGILIDWHLMSSTGLPTRSSCGIALSPSAGLIEPNDLDYVAVIGGLLYRGRQIDRRVRDYLLRAATAGTGLIGVCTGAFVLCRLGLMKGKNSCISWFHHSDFISEFDELSAHTENLYVVEGDIITSSGGVGSALVAAYVVEKHIGTDAAQKALSIMQIDKAAYMVQPSPFHVAECSDARVKRALLLMDQTVTAPIPTGQIASRLGVSRRHLERLFLRHLNISPLKAYLDMRLKRVTRLLKTQKALHQIACETGFANSARLSTAFKKRFDCSPSSARAALRPGTDKCLTKNTAISLSTPVRDPHFSTSI